MRIFQHKPPLPSPESPEPGLKVAVTKRILRANTRGRVAGLRGGGRETSPQGVSLRNIDLISSVTVQRVSV